MNRLTTLLLALAFAVPAAHAQDKGYWRASSQSAKTITGDIQLADQKIGINFLGFAISQIRPLQPAETSAVFDVESTAAGAASLYRVSIPADRKFLHKNSLCGGDEATWMVTYAAAGGRTLQVAFFSGAKPPEFTLDAISASTEKCGTFAYIR